MEVLFEFTGEGRKKERKKERRRRSWVLWRVIVVTFYVTEELQCILQREKIASRSGVERGERTREERGD